LVILVFLFVIAIFASMIAVIVYQSKFYDGMRKALDQVASTKSS